MTWEYSFSFNSGGLLLSIRHNDEQGGKLSLRNKEELLRSLRMLHFYIDCVVYWLLTTAGFNGPSARDADCPSPQVALSSIYSRVSPEMFYDAELFL